MQETVSKLGTRSKSKWKMKIHLLFILQLSRWSAQRKCMARISNFRRGFVKSDGSRGLETGF